MKQIHFLLSPERFYKFSGRMIPWVGLFTILVLGTGIGCGLFATPPDYQQGDAYRIMYLHVPAAILSLFVYSFMAFFAAIFLIWRIKVAGVLMRESASIGALFTGITLVTGAIWGKPMWGTWWIWDARLTSELVLFFIYLATILLQSNIKAQDNQLRMVAAWVLIGLVDIPIVHFSVEWWTTLHQGYSISLIDKPKIATTMLYPLAMVWIAFIGFYVTVLLVKSRFLLLQQEKRASWVRKHFQLPRGFNG